MRQILITAALCVAGLIFSHVARAGFNLVPEPQHVAAGTGVFELNSGGHIEVPDDARAQWIGRFLRDHIKTQTGVALKVATAPDYGRIRLRIDPSVKGRGAYRLEVTPQRILITAASNRGLFWGVQTLRQLLPLQQEVPPVVPAVSIADAPKYPWRGVMLDVARHFYPVSFVKQQIDLMSYYKLDVFHWHLTDDQGWRIQIPRYPKLTSVGAWRTGADGKRYGGFYTDAQIREVVAYAQRRNVLVVPEIEMPGHTSAAIAAYPELSCNDAKITVPTTWGVLRNVDCVSKASTYRFLENVLDEVTKLFPSPYVHIGGDEVPAGVWADCAACQQLAKEKNLDGETGLHGYFVNRIGAYLAGKGKTMVGWDEILEGGKLSPRAIVEVWRGDAEAKRAFANGNRIVLAGPFYLDTPIDRMTLHDLYRDDPFDAPLYADHPAQVLGGEAPLWSERATPMNGAARLYPRLLALSEHFWNPAAHDWKSFQLRARAQEAWLASQGVPYGPANRDIVSYHLDFVPAYKRWRIRAERGFEDLRVRYTLDGTQPTAQSPSFADVLDLYHPATVTVAPFRNGRQAEASTTFHLIDSLALGDPVTFATAPDPQYNGGPLQLTDGILGSTNFHDGRWDGWQSGDMAATIDLGHPTAIHGISVGFLQSAQSGIALPSSVTFEVSSDDKTWTTLQATPLKVDATNLNPFIHTVAFKAAAPVTARYVRVVAQRYGQPVNGFTAWLFADEISVQ